MDWLQRITNSLADGTGTDGTELTLDDATRTSILDVARTASHTSGDRTNAPLLCYVLGMLAARGVPPARTIPIVERDA